MFWLSRITEHSTYAGGLLGPELLTGIGFGLLFVPMSLVALAKVDNNDAGVASSLLNVGQQVGGSIGLAILGTVAWSAVANSLRSQAAAVKARGARLCRPGTRAADPDVQPRAGDGLLKGLHRLGGDHGAGADRRADCDPGPPRGPVRRGPDGGARRLTAAPTKMALAPRPDSGRLGLLWQPQPATTRAPSVPGFGD